MFEELMNSELEFPRVNYIGNKDKLASWISDSLPINKGTVLDLFAGGSSVSYELKKRGFRVISNDSLYSSYVVNKALIENKSDILSLQDIKNAESYDSKNNECSKDLSWMSNNLFFPYEVKELETLVCFSLTLESYKKYLFQALIRRAMIRKLPYSRMNIGWNNIKKLRDEDYSYKKYGRRRAYHNKSFKDHIKADLESYNNAVFDNGENNIVEQLDSLEALKKYNNFDLVYLDPPYPGTMNNYEEFYGGFDKAFSRQIEYRDWTSEKNFIKRLEEILEVSKLKTKYLLLSLNTKVKPEYTKVIEVLSSYGKVTVSEKKHNYQISGKLNKNKNIELLITLEFMK